MKTSILQAPVCHMKELNNLFIEMTAKNCNQRCRQCYIDFPISKNVKDFIPIDTIKKALSDSKEENIHCIYLTGAEPMTHPDFNNILRLCLKHSNVCISTNGSFINEKKARFLKKVQDEGDNEIIFKLGICHFEEIKNDEVRSRGSYRQVMHAIKHLIKYDFNPIIEIGNYYNEGEALLTEKFITICNTLGYNVQKCAIHVNKWFLSDNNMDFIPENNCKTDCEYGRILTSCGVYTCPFLANDYRGRCGSDLTDYSKKTTLETSYCNTCLTNKRQVFSIDFSKFNC